MKTNTYAGIPDELGKLERAKIVLIPVPYDGTSTWQKGADKGPQAFLEASGNMELYDIETATEVFGGEHSVSIGTIRAFNEMYPSLTVLHIDAHADLRKEYDGSTCNHACAVYEASQTSNLIQVGIRSMDIMEKTIMDEEKTYFAHEMAIDDTWMDSAIDQMTDNVFITFDLDAFDPSILPSTGTPEPGGLFWYETLGFLKQVFEEKNVVGFDIVELCPNKKEKSSDFLAAKLYYKMLSYKFMNEAIDGDYDNTYENSKQKTNTLKFSEEDDY